jgi:hypothetical protein
MGEKKSTVSSFFQDLAMLGSISASGRKSGMRFKRRASAFALLRFPPVP